MALNISSQYIDPSTLDTLPTQDNQNATNNQISAQEQTLPTSNTTSSILAEGLKNIAPETSQNKDKDIVVELPKNSDGKTTTPEKMDFGKYEESFLKAGFQKVGLNDATPQEINKFQREYNALTNNTIGLQVSLSELQTVQKQNSQGKIPVKVSDYDLKVFSAGKEQILTNRQQQTEITNKAVQASRSYADDAIAGFYKVQINGLVNTANEATKIVGLPEIPKLEVKGEFWEDKKESVELATTIAAGVLTGKGAVGTVIEASTGVAHGVEIVTGKDIRTGEQLSPLERSVRFVSASSSAIALGKPAKELASKVASKFDDFDIGPPTLQPATANGVALNNVSTSALPAVKTAPANSPNSTNVFNVVSNATSGISQLPEGDASSTSKASNLSDPAESAANAVQKVGDTNQPALAPIEKFKDYIFKPGAQHGKEKVFESLGYNRSHSEQLTEVYQEQATAKYKEGNYTLGKKDDYGQRISIEIKLEGVGNAAGKTSYLNSGWMIRPDGTITLNTPFSGFTK